MDGLHKNVSHVTYNIKSKFDLILGLYIYTFIFNEHVLA